MALPKVPSVKGLLTKPLRLPRLRPYTPGPDDPPVFWFNSERKEIIAEVVRRLEDRCDTERLALEYVLNEVAFEEAARLSSQRDDEASESLGFWTSVKRKVGKMTDDERRKVFREICERMAKDVAGNFDPRVYHMATRVVPHLLTGVLKPTAFKDDLKSIGTDAPSQLDEMLKTEGSAAQLRRLAKLGTLVFVPTHSSNLDSVALGYALQKEGLPPVVYGAGKNLFSNPIISFFMHNLGAYRVDRRIRASLYKDVLKTYSTVMIERGYHSLFFPGGTRSRSNMVERKLKLGLAGTAVEAFARNRVRGIARPVFFVPTTINYGLVLEGETLIEDWLKEAGRARYIIDDDEFSQIDRWLAFLRKLAHMESACVIRFGQPLDPFGNPVDEEGRSLAPDGRAIDAGSYVMRGGVAVLDAQRDAGYTRDLGQRIAEHFERDTVLMSTHIVSHVLFRALVRATPGADLFGRLRHRGEVSMPRRSLELELEEVLVRAKELERRGEVRLSNYLRSKTPAELVDRVLETFDGYHRHQILSLEGVGDEARVTIEDPTMVLYYQNRVVAYAERLAEEKHRTAAREIVRMSGAR